MKKNEKEIHIHSNYCGEFTEEEILNKTKMEEGHAYIKVKFSLRKSEKEYTEEEIQAAFEGFQELLEDAAFSIQATMSHEMDYNTTWFKLVDDFTIIRGNHGTPMSFEPNEKE